MNNSSRLQEKDMYDVARHARIDRTPPNSNHTADFMPCNVILVSRSRKYIPVTRDLLIKLVLDFEFYLQLVAVYIICL